MASTTPLYEPFTDKTGPLFHFPLPVSPFKVSPNPQLQTHQTQSKNFLSANNYNKHFTTIHKLILVFVLSCFSSKSMAKAAALSNGITLESVRESLIRQEDTVIFCLIERAKYPRNSPLYDQSQASIPGFSGSLLQYIVKQSESLQATVGRYENPEEQPFFPDNLPASLLPPHNYPRILHPAAASVNVNKAIWDMYFNQLLPLFVEEGDDGNYAATATRDLECLQALSRRIHYGKFVAEVKFRDAPEEYEPLIRAKDSDALMKLLTFEAVEEMVKKRVEKKTMVFAQDVTLQKEDTEQNLQKYKIDPSLVSRLYGEWVMPLTKDVEVEYLLRRLD